MAEPLHLRPVTLDDADLLLRWRNDDETRLQSRSTERIERVTHVDWLKTALADQRRLLRILAADGRPVALIRYDVAPDGDATIAEVSIVVAPEARGSGYGAEALRLGQELVVEKWPRLRQVVAVVHAANAGSQRLFERAAFVHDRDEGGGGDGWLCYQWSPLASGGPPAQQRRYS